MIFTYESVRKPHRTFELDQRMCDPAFAHHPETGAPIRRIITGGSGFKKTCFTPINKLTMDDCKGSKEYAAAMAKPLRVSPSTPKTTTGPKRGRTRVS